MIAGHGLDDFGVRGRAVLCEQRRRLHDLPGLAKAALRNADLAPCLLHRVLAVGAQTLDRRDRSCRRLRERRLAGAHGDAVDMNGAGAADAGAASELGARSRSSISRTYQSSGMFGIAAEFVASPLTVTDGMFTYSFLADRRQNAADAICAVALTSRPALWSRQRTMQLEWPNIGLAHDQQCRRAPQAPANGKIRSAKSSLRGRTIWSRSRRRRWIARRSSCP